MGRPKGYYESIRLLASVGASLETIANRVGANSSRTFRRTLEKDPRAKEALEQGRAEMESELVGSLYRQAMDPKNRNPAPAIFLLKAMRGFIDTPQPKQPENRVEVTFQLPAPLNREQYSQLVEVAPPKALKDVNEDAA